MELHATTHRLLVSANIDGVVVFIFKPLANDVRLSIALPGCISPITVAINQVKRQA